MTQADLAAAADVADATVSRIERGRLVPSVDLAGRLAEALGRPVDDLLGAVRAKAEKPGLRPSVARLVALTRGLGDAEVDDIVRAVKLLLAVGRRSGGVRGRPI